VSRVFRNSFLTKKNLGLSIGQRSTRSADQNHAGVSPIGSDCLLYGTKEPFSIVINPAEAETVRSTVPGPFDLAKWTDRRPLTD
jgi:hypothetical protein